MKMPRDTINIPNIFCIIAFGLKDSSISEGSHRDNDAPIKNRKAYCKPLSALTSAAGPREIAKNMDSAPNAPNILFITMDADALGRFSDFEPAIISFLKSEESANESPAKKRPPLDQIKTLKKLSFRKRYFIKNVEKAKRKAAAIAGTINPRIFRPCPHLCSRESAMLPDTIKTPAIKSAELN